MKGPAFLVVLVLGASASVVAIGLTVLSNWFFRGQAGISGDQVARLVILGFVVGTMPLGLLWLRSRKREK
jgi:hypothetical protein